MEEIRTYLDKMFSGLPATDKVRKAKSELLTTMTDKYSELISEGKSENEALGTVIMEFGNLNELSDELGLTEEIRSVEERTVVITRAAAETYRRAHDKYGLFLAIGVSLFILSPVQLIVNVFIGEWGVGSVLHSVLIAAGMGILLVCIAAGVGLIIFSESQKPRLKDLNRTPFRLDAEADAYVRKNQAVEERNGVMMTVAAIACFIFAAMPPIVSAVIPTGGAWFINDAIEIGSAVATLIIVAVGVGLIIFASVRNKYFKILLNERADRSQSRIDRRVKGVIGSIWALTLPVYLIVSFVWNAWGISWIIFPFVAAICSIIRIAASVKEPEN